MLIWGKGADIDLDFYFVFGRGGNADLNFDFGRRGKYWPGFLFCFWERGQILTWIFILFLGGRASSDLDVDWGKRGKHWPGFLFGFWEKEKSWPEFWFWRKGQILTWIFILILGGVKSWPEFWFGKRGKYWPVFWSLQLSAKSSVRMIKLGYFQVKPSH